MMPGVEQLIRLDGKRAIVTGAASGIGRAIAQLLGMAGARVGVADIDRDAAEAVVAEFVGQGIDAHLFEVDVRSEASVVAMFEDVESRFGGLDILVNNAGAQNRSYFESLDSALWNETVDVNLRGTFLCMREGARRMAADKIAGRIVNISSVASFRAFAEGLTAYNASKAGVNALTRNGAREFAPHGIRVNAIAPGVTETPGARNATGPVVAFEPLIPLTGRFAQPEEIAIVADGGDLAR